MYKKNQGKKPATSGRPQALLSIFSPQILVGVYAVNKKHFTECFFLRFATGGYMVIFQHPGTTEIVYRVNAGEDTFPSGNFKKKRISANCICKNNLKAGEVKWT